MNTTLPDKVILTPTAPLYSMVRRLGGAARRDRRLGLFRYALLPECGNQTAVTGPALGAPAAALLADKLVSSGVKRILLLSVCGSLSQDLRIGDLFIPSGGISEEGTSKLYRQGDIPGPDPGMMKQIRKAGRKSEMSVHEGTLWTTDAPLRETKEKIDDFKKQGALAVDMEYTALAALSHYYGYVFASLMVISDEAYKSPPIFGLHKKKFLKGLEKASKIAINLQE